MPPLSTASLLLLLAAPLGAAAFWLSGPVLPVLLSIGAAALVIWRAGADTWTRSWDALCGRLARITAGPGRRGLAPARAAPDRAAGLSRDLRTAVQRGELELYFQPQVELATGALIGAEALLRWRHPLRGVIPPGEFIGLAEQSGQIREIGDHALHAAATQAARWAAEGLHCRVAVNVSALQFGSDDTARRLLAVLSAAGADPRWIELEITESLAMGDPEQAARELGTLRQAGLRIAIDDFGTGFSNLAVLTRLPFDALKIDRSFIHDLLRDRRAATVVRTILALADNLGVETVAEGIETAAERDMLLAAGCRLGQGFLFGRPMMAHDFAAWARQNAAHLRAPDGARPPRRVGLRA